MPDILVVGSLNTDLVVRAPRFPQPGETISGEDLQVIPGGKGANQAVAAARLGAKVSMLGRVGKDNFGDFLLDNLKSNNVDSRLIQRDDASTGTAIIVVDSNGQNSIVLSAGANGKVNDADVNTASFSDYRLLLLQLEIPTPTVLSAAKRAHENGLRVILNPAPAKQLPDELIALADFLIPNETELSLLTNIEVKDNISAEKAARALLERGVKNVIVTLGSKGALIVTGKQVTHVDTYTVDVVDTTAAGDAFIGGFASCLIKTPESDSSLALWVLSDAQKHTPKGRLALQSAVRYGCACGALATTKFGAQPSLPTKEEVEKFIS
ncbi:MAG: ribokinase [Anaerolineae bacterium]|nr:ribokinase [Anaerolineae bacterium]MCI0609237.1 ribokinase [Anaerolineae bacterium]